MFTICGVVVVGVFSSFFFYGIYTGNIIGVGIIIRFSRLQRGEWRNFSRLFFLQLGRQE